MRKALLLFSFLLLSHFLVAQSDTTAWLDFWVGEWSLRWTDRNGKQAEGTNVITKILDDNVVLENFSYPGSNFNGVSISVYNPQHKKWFQSWADNFGGYYTLEGSLEGANRIFESTRKISKDGKDFYYRMVFHSITEDGFIWDWESSPDHLHWTSEWKIFYSRR